MSLSFKPNLSLISCLEPVKKFSVLVLVVVLNFNSVLYFDPNLGLEVEGRTKPNNESSLLPRSKLTAFLIRNLDSNIASTSFIIWRTQGKVCLVFFYKNI